MAILLPPEKLDAYTGRQLIAVRPISSKAMQLCAGILLAARHKNMNFETKRFDRSAPFRFNQGSRARHRTPCFPSTLLLSQCNHRTLESFGLAHLPCQKI